ncbi:hypothetical protein AB4305_13180 [Nocardia sp. 2YAB30]|uniref:hypothetical protein n=1 Tax=unclassified Nocardia TaxID=2637762 RepID=UPI003F9C46C2
MSTGFDVCAELARGVADRAGAWQFIKGFAAHWSSPLTAADGWTDAELAAVENRLGFRLPLAMREAYGLFGRRADLTSNQDEFLPPDRLQMDEDGEMLTFRVENQGIWDLGISMADLAVPDPPVMVRSDIFDESSDICLPWLDRFSLACIEVVLSESVYSAMEEFGDVNCLTLSDETRLEQLYSRLPIPEYPQLPAEAGYRWFAGPDVLLRVDPADCLFVRARTPEALDQVRRSLPGGW